MLIIYLEYAQLVLSIFQESDAHRSEETQCEKFAEKGLKNSLSNVLNMNVIGEFKQVFNNDSIEMSPRIRCEA